MIARSAGVSWKNDVKAGPTNLTGVDASRKAVSAASGAVLEAVLPAASGRGHGGAGQRLADLGRGHVLAERGDLARPVEREQGLRPVLGVNADGASTSLGAQRGNALVHGLARLRSRDGDIPRAFAVGVGEARAGLGAGF